MFSGAMTAMVTPFREGKLDENRLREQVEYQIKNGIDALVPVGTTGESPTLDFKEHARVIELTVQFARGRVPVIAGVGANATSEALELHQIAKRVGATAGLSVNPYYNKPTQEGLVQHYQAIAKAVRIPIVVYSVQGRTGINVEPATLARLAQIPNIIGVKEASGNIGQMANVIQEVPPGFTVLCGDDAIALPLIALGGRGLISVVSNEIPGEMTQLIQACLKNDFETARALQARYLPLMNVNFVESNPIPVKAAMGLMGLLEPVYRLPLCAPSPANLARIEKVLAAVGLLGKVRVAS